MKRIGLAILAVGALSVGATQLEAQASFGVGVGLTMPMGDYGDVASTGFHAMGSVLFGMGTGPMQIRADLAYHHTGLEGGADGSTTLIGGMANLVYNFATTGTAKPYAMLGVGYFSEKAESGGSVDDNGIGYGIGFGINFAMSAASLFAEVKYQTIAENDTFTAANFVPITVGVRFGGK